MFGISMQMGEGGRHGDTDEDTVFDTPAVYKTGHPRIGHDEEGEEVDDENVIGGDGGPNSLEVQDLDDDEKGLTEDELRRIQKGDSIDILSELCMKPKELFRLHIPLCRLVAMPMVRPTLACDITKLEQEFAGGYRYGAAVFYISTTNEEGQNTPCTKCRSLEPCQLRNLLICSSPGRRKGVYKIGFPRSGTPYPRRSSRHSYSGYVAFFQRRLEFFKFQLRS